VFFKESEQMQLSFSPTSCCMFVVSPAGDLTKIALQFQSF